MKKQNRTKREGGEQGAADLERARVRFTLTAGMQAALDTLPKGKHDPARDEHLFLRYALAEGICALADHYKETGRLVVPFRFEVVPGEPLRLAEYEEVVRREEQCLMKWLSAAFLNRLAEGSGGEASDTGSLFR